MIEELIERDLIGEITSVTADFGFPLEHIKRMTEPELAGGVALKQLIERR